MTIQFKRNLQRFFTSAYSTGKEMCQHAVITIGMQGVLSGGETFRLIHTSLMTPEKLRMQNGLLHHLYTRCIENFYSSDKVGWVQQSLNSIRGVKFETIASSPCPRKSLLDSIQTASGITYTHSDLTRIVLKDKVLIPTILEEMVFRGVIQDVALKKMPNWLAQRILPNQAHYLDSKIYTACRIILSSYLCLKFSDPTFKASTYEDFLFSAPFLLGIAFGIIKETGGLRCSIVAHGINSLMHTLSLGLTAPC